MITIHWSTLGAMEPETMAAIQRAHRAIEQGLDVRFEVGGADITYTESDLWGTSAAYVGLPSTVWLLPGEQGKWALHETGHALGLAHPHEIGRPELGMTDSVMSYTWDTYSPVLGRHLIPQGLMAWDVAELTAVYGRSHQADGNTVWRPDPTELGSILDWEGVDLLDLRGSAGAYVDLDAGWVRHGQGGSTWVLPDAIERVALSPGQDVVVLSAGDVIMGLARNDVLVANDGEVDRLSKREVRALGLGGRVYEVDGAYIMWAGSERSLEGLVVEG